MQINGGDSNNIFSSGQGSILAVQILWTGASCRLEELDQDDDVGDARKNNKVKSPYQDLMIYLTDNMLVRVDLDI